MSHKKQMPLPSRLELVRDVLDKPLVDRRGKPMGRVDRIVLAIEGDRPPRVARMEIGVTVLADRISTRLGKWIQRLGARLGLHRGKPVRIQWSKLKSIGIELQLDTDAERSPALAWERWLRARVTQRIPGIKPR
ncbi:MAG TPA: hypothetical protein VHD56_06275 [Tepidisphaeraceae bacterium]|nr:hypothetical protein [Tepidisphaeraceae bacterium]